MSAVDDVVVALRRSRKYRGLPETTLRRAARDAVARSDRTADAVDRARSRLHQVFGAFLPASIRRRLQSLADEIDADPAGAEPLARAALALHRSTAERSGHEVGLYREVFAVTGPPSSVLDLGCGLAPLGLPAMGLPADCRYTGVDLDVELCSALDRVARRLHPGARVVAGDVLAEPPTQRVDVVLLLKVATTLEHAEPGGCRRLLGALDAAFAVVTFPRRSLSGAQALETRRLQQVLLSGYDAVEVPCGAEHVVVLRYPARPEPP